MGRPIQKKWFRALDRGTNSDLTVTTQSGDEPIIRQKGTGVYDVASARVRLVDGAPAAANECQLQHDGNNVNKITQYRVFYFSGGSAVWRDRDNNIIGAFNPVMTVEDVLNIATATAAVANGAVTGYTVTLGGAEYTGAPAVTVSNPNGVDAVLTGDVIHVGGVPQANQDALITTAGSGYVDAPVITQTGGTGINAVLVASLTNGVVTTIASTGGTGYDSNDTWSITAVPLVQATATATITGDAVTSIAVNVAGTGYASATVTVAGP